MLSGTEDKAKGGNDFQEVRKVGDCEDFDFLSFGRLDKETPEYYCMHTKLVMDDWTLIWHRNGKWTFSKQGCLGTVAVGWPSRAV